MDEARYRHTMEELGARLDNIDDTAPIPYRTRNGGDYMIPSCVLKDGVSNGRTGLDIHLAGEG